MKRLLIVADSAHIGGHERMTIALVRALVDSAGRRVELMALVHHAELVERLAGVLPVEQLECANSTPLPFLRNLEPGAIVALRQRMRKFRPDAVLVAQGDIEQGLRGVLAARSLGLHTTSYLPMAFDFADVGARLGRVRDLLGRAFYRAPDAYITIAAHQRALLARRTRAPIAVVPNVVDVAPPVSREPRPALRPDAIRLAVIGRVVFQHKQQHLIPELCELLRVRGIEPSIDIIGDGPDAPRLRAMVKERGLERHVHMLGWLSAPELASHLESHVDAVLMPSRIEGVPLVFLESAMQAVPVFVPPLPFAGEYPIPPLFALPSTAPADMADAVERVVRTRDCSGVQELGAFVRERHSPAAMQRAAAGALALALGARP